MYVTDSSSEEEKQPSLSPSLRLALLLAATQNERVLKNLALFGYKNSVEENPCYCVELEEDMRYIRRR